MNLISPKKIALLLLLIVAIDKLLFGQNINPAKNEVFVYDEVTKIELTMSNSDKQALIYPLNASLDIYYPVEMHFTNSKVDTIINRVGIRIRGNTSRRAQKKSYKIDFKEYGGEQFFKLKKLNLKPNNNDPSQLRETLSWQMFRNMNVPAARTSYVQLYMNGEYMGLFLNVENIDDEFVDRRFGNEAGNLYKCAWGATLDKALNVYDNSHYELKTNEAINNRFKLQTLVNLLASPQNDEWPLQLEQIFDVDNYLRQLAVESIIGHWDGYSFNINNYYLYEDPETNRIHFIPYDLDNTWGIDWIGHDWGKEDLLSWYTTSYQVPLTRKILNVDKYYKQYITCLYETMEWFKLDYIGPIAQSYQQLLAETVRSDHYYPLDYGYTINDFLAAYDAATGGHVNYSISNYIETRLEYAFKQLPEPTLAKALAVSGLKVYPNPSNGRYIQISDKTDQKLLIFDMYGKQIDFSKEMQLITFSTLLSPGLYLVQSEIGVTHFIVGN